MRTIIAGSRSIEDYDALKKAVLHASGIWGSPTVIISGTARGVDRLGERWAEEHGVPVVQYPAEWGKYGRGAGVVRNREMAADADYAVILWDGVSNGTHNMVTEMAKLGKPVHKTTLPTPQEDGP